MKRRYIKSTEFTFSIAQRLKSSGKYLKRRIDELLKNPDGKKMDDSGLVPQKKKMRQVLRSF